MYVFRPDVSLRLASNCMCTCMCMCMCIYMRMCTSVEKPAMNAPAADSPGMCVEVNEEHECRIQGGVEDAGSKVSDFYRAALACADTTDVGVRMTRKRSIASVMPKEASPPRKSPPRLRQPVRRLYSIAFTWPAGASWLSAHGDRKRAPSWYADRITELIELRAADGRSSFLVHVHGAISPAMRSLLEERWQAAFRRARQASITQPGGRQPSDESLELVVCDKALPPMWPAAARIAPVFDHPGESAVIVIDVHDSLPKQTAEIDSLLTQAAEESSCLALTAWPGYGLRSSFRRDDPTLAPPALLAIDRTDKSQSADVAAGIVWHLDCGLLVSLPGFRRRLRAFSSPALPRYSAHLKHCFEQYEYDSSRGSDEMILEMYLLAGRPANKDFSASLFKLLRSCSSLRVHMLCPDSKQVSVWVAEGTPGRADWLEEAVGGREGVRVCA